MYQISFDTPLNFRHLAKPSSLFYQILDTFIDEIRQVRPLQHPLIEEGEVVEVLGEVALFFLGFEQSLGDEWVVRIDDDIIRVGHHAHIHALHGGHLTHTAHKLWLGDDNRLLIRR